MTITRSEAYKHFNAAEISGQYAQIIDSDAGVKELADHCHQLYERFRPEIPGGTKGWGAKGDLHLGVIEELAKAKA